MNMKADQQSMISSWFRPCSWQGI